MADTCGAIICYGVFGVLYDALPVQDVNRPEFELTPRSWTVNSQEQAACNRYSTGLLPPSFNLMRFLL